MKSTKNSLNTNNNGNFNPHPWAPKSIALARTVARDYANYIDYQHPYPSMARFADHLALSYDANRTRHSYYRQLRLIHQHAGCEPDTPPFASTETLNRPSSRRRLRPTA